MKMVPFHCQVVISMPVLYALAKNVVRAVTLTQIKKNLQQNVRFDLHKLKSCFRCIGVGWVSDSECNIEPCRPWVSTQTVQLAGGKGGSSIGQILAG